MTTAVDICNRSLELAAAQTRITALNDGSPAGNAAGILYQPTVDVVLREIDPSFARRVEPLVPAAAATRPWLFEYLYPADCLRLRQVRAQPGSANKDDPQPVRATVGLDLIASVPTKVILTNMGNALAAYTSTLATVDQWDSGFAEAVVRRLANPFAMAIAGRPDFARELLEEAEKYSQLAESIDET